MGSLGVANGTTSSDRISSEASTGETLNAGPPPPPAPPPLGGPARCSRWACSKAQLPVSLVPVVAPLPTWYFPTILSVVVSLRSSVVFHDVVELPVTSQSRDNEIRTSQDQHSLHVCLPHNHSTHLCQPRFTKNRRHCSVQM